MPQMLHQKNQMFLGSMIQLEMSGNGFINQWNSMDVILSLAKEINLHNQKATMKKDQDYGWKLVEFASYCRIGEYSSMSPGDKDPSTGFRVAITIPQKSK